MIHSHLVFLGAFSFLVVGGAAALNCYACAGSSTSDCAKGKLSAMVVQPCTFNFGSRFRHFNRTNKYYNNNNNTGYHRPHQPVCFQLFDTDFKPKMFARGCGLVPLTSDPCEFVSKFVHVQGCKSCKTDLCNGNHKENPILSNSIS